jgi:hypothetical protein
MARKILDHLERLLLGGPSVVIEVALDLLEPAADAGGHILLDALAIPLKLFDNEIRDDQFNLPLEGKQAEGDDPSLTVAQSAQVQPGRCVHKQVQHEVRISASFELVGYRADAGSLASRQ